jgi:cytochrome c553
LGGILRWTGRIALATLITAAMFVAAIYLFSSLALMHRWPPSRQRLTVAPSPALVAEGQQIAVVYGCNGCHGGDLTGAFFFNEPDIAQVWGPNLTRVTAAYSDHQLEQAIRHGVRANGRPLIIMPSQAFSQFSDHEVAAVISYLRSVRPTGPVRPGPRYGFMGRLGLLLGQFQTAPQLVDEALRRPLPDFGPAYDRGRDLVRACTECHGPDLRGTQFVGAPDLAIAAQYSPEDFRRLLHTGIARGNRRLGLMTEVAPERFAGLSAADIDALQGYLIQRAQAPAGR